MIDLSPEPLSLCHGGAVPLLQTLPSLPEVLQRAAQTHQGITYIDAEGQSRHQPYRDLQQRALEMLGGMQGLGLTRGDRVVLQILEPDSLLAGIWACWLGGLVAVPIAPSSRLPTEADTGAALQAIAHQVEAALVLVSQSQGTSHPPAGPDRPLTPLAALPHPDRPPSLHPTPGPGLALILFTSGSTGHAKGVMLTVQNLLVSASGMATVNGLTAASTTLNWMPLEHVASLVMFHLSEVWVGCSQIQVANGYILPDPLRWLDLIHQFRVTATWAPNFAYGLINERAKDIAQRQWDLSSVQWMGNGAEAVVRQTTHSFLRLLAPHGLAAQAVSPGYGMSETCSGIVHSHRFTAEDSHPDQPFVEVGTPIPGVSLRIVDDQDRVVPEGVIGALQVRGLTITAGYYGRPELNAEVFTEDGWFRTGDLGLIRQGRLTITGRQKDLIIVNGTNVYSHEIEQVVEELPEVEVSYTAACGVRRRAGTTETLAIFLHPAEPDADLGALIKAVRRQVMARLGVMPEYVIPVDRAAIPKTAIGKIQRRQLAQQFEAGQFEQRLAAIATLLQPPVREQPRNQIEQQLAQIWQSVLSVESVGVDDQFFELGGTSLHLMQVLHQLQQQGYRVTAVDLFQHATLAALAAFLRPAPVAPASPPLPPRAKRRQGAGDIAVIGMAGRFPGATCIDQFWHNVSQGVESITWFTDAELLAAGVDRSLVAHPHYVKASPTLQDIDGFDAEFFGYSPREAELLDPQQRLMLECAWEALETAGYDALGYAQTGGAIALYAGAAMNTYVLNQVYPNRGQLDANDSLGVVTLGSMGGFQLAIANDKDYLTTRVSYKLNLTGASVNVQTACSTSLVAIHLACQSLLQGDCEMALAGGVSVHAPQQVGHLYQEGMILSPDGHCRAFDAQAQGTIFGSGVGIVVLKRLEEAIADGDSIYAVVKGSAIGNDGGMKVGYLAPRADGQATVIEAAMAVAGVEADSITYVEAHGTGTALGDPIEVAALTQAFRQQTRRHQFCALGSVKTNVGHLNVASGVVGFIKTVLALHHRQIPPSLHFETPNPQIDFAHSPFFVNTQLRDWPTEGTPRRAGVNSLGIGGTNVHVILEEAPVPSPAPADGEERPLHLLTLSAKHPAALGQLVDRYREFLSTHPQTSLADLCFTANGGRSPFPHRMALVASSLADLETQLRQWTGDGVSVATGRPTLAMAFTGQGSQYPGMGHQLYQTQPVFRQAIDRCDRWLQPRLGLSLLDLLYGEEHPPAALDQTLYTQVAVFTVDYALFELWCSWGVRPDLVLGHSLGDYVAACVAGVFSLEDALRLVLCRGQLMQAQAPGAMAAVFAPVEQVRSQLAAIGETVAIAAYNGPDHLVLSGPIPALQMAIALCQQQGWKTVPLSVSHAFHSPQMEPMVDAFRAAAQQIRYALPTLPLISSLTGQMADAAIATPEYWCQHLCQPVQFAAGLAQLQSMGCDLVLECGAKPVLSGIGQAQPSPLVWLPSLHPHRQDWAQMLHSLAHLYRNGVAIDWRGFDQPYRRRRIALPTYPFQRQRYWLEPPPTPVPRPGSAIGHPLLGQKITTPHATLFETQISVALQPFLQDHRVHGQAVLPGAAYLEMGLAAGAVLWPDTPLRLEQVGLHRAMLLSEAPQTMQMALKRDTAERRLEIYSLRSPDEDDWVLHCTGTLRAGVAPPPPLDLPQLQRQFTQSLPWATVLQAHPGLEYGPRFQGVQQVWVNGSSVLAWVQLPPCLRSPSPSYHLHPALLDACFQPILAIAPPRPIPYLPIGLERLDYYHRPGDGVWSHIQIRQQTPERLVADVTLIDATGQRILEIQGLTATAVSAETLGLAPDWTPWLHTLDWQPQPLPPTLTPSPPGHWVIFADAAGLGQRLAQRLEAQQQSCTVVCPGSGGMVSERQGWVDPTDPDAIQRLMAALHRSDRPCRGILYLWGLGATALTATGDIYTPALYVTQALIRLGRPTALWWVTQGSQSLHIQATGLAQAPLWGLARTIGLEYPALTCHCVDLDTPSAQAEAGLLAELLAQAGASQIALHDGQRYEAQLRPYSLAEQSGEHRDVLHLSERGSMDHLSWQRAERRSPRAAEVELRVLATGLNFRDVLNVLGRYPGEAGALGLECVGQVVAVGEEVQGLQVGDRVVAIAPGSFSQFVTVRAMQVVPLPDGLSIPAAATVPTAFLTAEYALRQVAHLQRGDRFLIHAATGGVGLAAVQIAQRIGAEVFATASPAKWPILHQRGISQVYSSRSLDFEAQIRAATGEQGVDGVLNSLGGDFMVKSATLVRPGGHFIELGKPDAALVQHLHRLRPDLTYTLVDLMQETEQRPERIQTLLQQVMRQIQQGMYHPLPYTLFPRDRLVEAFRSMQQARHIGKVVVEIGQPSFQVRSDGFYLITGGLGGVGLQVAQALIAWGAKHLLLIGRKPPTPEAESLVQQWRQGGVEVIPTALDIADVEAVTHWFQREGLGGTRPLRGVFHGAGVLADGILDNQTPERFEQVMAAKLRGAWTLHHLTQAMPLDCFVLFSSAAALLGSAGQANYAAANAGLDALAHWRRSQGLPALSINWGAWAQVGMAARHGDGRWESRGLGRIEPETGVAILKALLSAPPPQVGVFPVPPSPGMAPEPVSPEAIAPGNPGLESLQSLPAEQRAATLATWVGTQVAAVLGLAPTQIQPDQGLSDLGLDSLTSVELSHKLQKQLGCPLPTTVLYNYPTLAQLTDYLLSLLPPSPATTAAIAPSSDPGEALESWSEAEAEALLLSELDRLNL